MNPYILLITLLCIVLPFLLLKKKTDTAALSLYYLVLLSHLAVAVVFANNIIAIPGLDKDPMRFYRFGKQIAERGHFKGYWLDSALYDNFIGMVFYLMSPSILLGCMTSIFAFSICILILFKLIKLLEIDRPNIHFVSLAFLFALLPSTLCYTSVTLREAWQILFIASALLAYLFAIKKERYRYALLTIPPLLGLMMLHNGLYIYALLSPLALIATPKRKTIGLFSAIIFICLINHSFPKLLYQINQQAFKPTQVVQQFEKGNFSIIKYTQQYRRNINYGQSNYSISLDKTSPKNLIKTGTAIVISYMFRPFPNELYRLRDVYAFGEVLLRIVLIISFLWGWLFMDREKKIISIFLGLHYSFLMLPWAAGTTTWGTALRHHTTHQFILVILGTMGAVALYEHLKQRRKQKFLFPTHP